MDVPGDDDVFQRRELPKHILKCAGNAFSSDLMRTQFSKFFTLIK